MRRGRQASLESKPTFFAHSLEGVADKSRWQPLDEHLQNVAALAAEFASAFGAREWGYLAGLWHDLGKYSQEFQDYLSSQQEACAETQAGRVDHSTAGAQYAAMTVNVLGHLIGYAIAGHHAGLLDGRAKGVAQQEARLRKKILAWEHGLARLGSPPTPSLSPPKFLCSALARRDAFPVAFFTRMVFSCLVDADFLDTERFLDAFKAEERASFPTLRTISERFFQSLKDFDSRQTLDPINETRQGIRSECLRAAGQPPGFFSLTVPTGGGKTLSSLAFSLRHALDYDLRRIVYVVPFTTIIEQNADVFRRHLGSDCVIEHHCNIDPEKETAGNRLAAENWDAPVVVTTSVQFYESLFANRPSRCRKLHRLARSVVILDEAQTIPVDFLNPCLRALRELVENYGCTVVLCTATQPEIQHRTDFEIGLKNVREIVSDPERLHLEMQRVELIRIGKKTDAELKKLMASHERVLCIVNTVRHARLLFGQRSPGEGHFHLSARMVPAHRRRVLDSIKATLSGGNTCRVVSTQVVEAGVDLDFPVVFRAMAGLDSIVQAAGRCNRNNMLPEKGRVFVFTTEHPEAERYFADTAGCAAQVMELYPDPLDLAACEHFFRLYYWDQKSRWDRKQIIERFQLEPHNASFPFCFMFSTVAEDFRLIDDQATCTVIVPWDDEAQELCNRLRHAGPTRELLRRLQPYMVQVRRREWDQHAGRDILLFDDNLGILVSPQTHYDPHTGLNLDADGPGIYLA